MYREGLELKKVFGPPLHMFAMLLVRTWSCSRIDNTPYALNGERGRGNDDDDDDADDDDFDDDDDDDDDDDVVVDM